MFLDLAPEPSFVGELHRGTIDEREYTKRYLKMSIDRKLDPNKIIDQLPDGAVLLCYESPNKFCHRHIVSYWLRHRTGIDIQELLNDPKIEIKMLTT